MEPLSRRPPRDEVNLVRLLDRCDLGLRGGAAPAVSSSTTGACTTAAATDSSTTLDQGQLEAAVALARTLLAQVVAASTQGSSGTAVPPRVERYRQRVDALARQVDILRLEQAPPVVSDPAPASPPLPAVVSGGRGAASQESPELVPLLTPASPSGGGSRQTVLLRQRRALFGARGDTQRDLTENEVEEELSRQRSMQEGISDEMVEMAAGLKENALEMLNVLKRDITRLGRVDELTGRNLTAAETTTDALSQQLRASWGSTCQTLGLLVMVLVLFFMVYAIMRAFPHR